MITPLIEQALVSGKGKFRTWSSMFAGVSKIRVPLNTYIIITDITINMFQATSNASEFVNFVKSDEYCLHTIDFFSQRGPRNSLLIRNEFSSQIDGEGRQYIKNSEPIHFDLFLKHDSDVYISILRIFGLPNAISTLMTPLDNTKEPQPPVGYGTTLPTLTRLEDAGSNIYFPCGSKEALNNILTSGSLAREIPSVNAESGNILYNGNEPLFNTEGPIINISYVEFTGASSNDIG